MVRFPALALVLRWSLVLVCSPGLVDDFQSVSLARPHSCRAQKSAQGTNVAPLAADDFTHVSFRDLQFDHIVIEMVDEDLVGSIDDPLRNLLDENANISGGFSHGIRLCRGNCRSDWRLGVELAHPL
jgi:hypothetical protein